MVSRFHRRPLPDSSALLSGRSPRDAFGFQSDRLQILYRNTTTPWSDPDIHAHSESDECFIVLSGVVVVEVDGERVEVGPREVCFFPAGTPHALIETHPPIEMFIIRAPSVEDKEYRSLGRWQWPDVLEEEQGG